MLPHPWTVLAAMRHVRILWVPMAARLGATDGHATIWLHPGQSQAERRCTLMHELVHLHRHHDGCLSGASEHDVEQAGARWLLPDIRAVVDALAWSAGHVPEAAEELWVDEVTLLARVAGLSAGELAELVERLAALAS